MLRLSGKENVQCNLSYIVIQCFPNTFLGCGSSANHNKTEYVQAIWERKFPVYSFLHFLCMMLSKNICLMKVLGRLNSKVSFRDAYSKHRISLFIICCGLTTLKCITNTQYKSVGKITLGILILCRHSGKETFQCYLSYSKAFLIVSFGNTFQSCGSSADHKFTDSMQAIRETNFPVFAYITEHVTLRAMKENIVRHCRKDNTGIFLSRMACIESVFPV